MKRFAVLALAAVFAFSFSASVAAAPVFSGEFAVEVESVQSADADPINFTDGPDLTLNLNASEEGLWDLSVELGSVAASDTTVLVPDGDDADENPDEATVTTNGIGIGEYSLSLTPGPFSVNVWGNEFELSEVADRFGFISSAADPVGPKFRLATSQMGVDLTVDYDTEASDAFYAFANAGMIGAAFADEDLGDENDGMVTSADVEVDLGLATVTAGFAYDLQIDPDTDSAMAYGVKAESEIASGLTVNAGYTSEGLDVADATNTIEGGVEYVLDVHTISAGVTNETTGSATPIMTVNGDYSYGEIANLGVEFVTDDSETPTLTFTADAEYAVIPDVLTVSGDFLMVNDKEVGFAEDDDYEWIDETEIGDFVVTVMEINASAGYSLTPAFTVTPGLGYAAYTFAAGEASAMTLSVDTEYTVSDAASITVGFENASGTVADTTPAGVDEEKITTLSAGVTVSF